MRAFLCKGTHPVLGLALGISAVLAALVPTLLFGAVGATAAILLGVAAAVLGLSALREGRGRGAVITSVAAVILAVIMVFASMNAVNRVCDRVSEGLGISGRMTPETAEYLERCRREPYMGFVPFISGLRKNADLGIDLGRALAMAAGLPAAASKAN